MPIILAQQYLEVKYYICIILQQQYHYYNGDKMINKSIWLKNIKDKRLPKLKEDIESDILIIGGGITGISCAYFLKDSNKNIVLVDAQQIGRSTTSRTTGKITYLQGPIYQKIDNIYGIAIAKKYLDSQKYACSLIRDIIIKNNIKCDYESNSSYLFTSGKTNTIKNEIKVFKKMGEEFKIKKELPISFPSNISIKIDNSAVFHPLKYVLSLKDICINSGIKMYENTMINNLTRTEYGYIASCGDYKIKTKKVILACFYPFFFKPGLFPFKTYIKKEYVGAALTDKIKRFNAIDDSKRVNSIRYHSDSKDYVIYTSESRKLGSNMDNEKRYKDLFWKMKSNFNNNIKYYWFNYDIMTPDNMPIIGYYEKFNKDLLIGTGYNAWGMTNGTLAGKIISDLILGNKNEYSSLFTPFRNTNIFKIFNTLSYNVKNVSSFISSKVNSNYDFYNDSVKVQIENGKKVGIYIDENKKEHKVYTTCPHMKCGLVFNMVDKTWDCPCHGSRFDIDGNVIKGPSVYDIKIK